MIASTPTPGNNLHTLSFSPNSTHRKEEAGVEKEKETSA
jgi:hypothetical protein